VIQERVLNRLFILYRNDFFSLRFTAAETGGCKPLSPWENASGWIAHGDHPSAFFQDANYHDQIVKERKRVDTAGRGADSHAGTDLQCCGIGRRVQED
jgi:hypothetical protein